MLQDCKVNGSGLHCCRFHTQQSVTLGTHRYFTVGPGSRGPRRDPGETELRANPPVSAPPPNYADTSQWSASPCFAGQIVVELWEEAIATASGHRQAYTVWTDGFPPGDRGAGAAFT